MKNVAYVFFLIFLMGSSFTYRQPNDALTIAIETGNPRSSSSNDGSLKISISGGSAPYVTQVLSTFSPSQVFEKKDRIEIKKLGVGTYTIFVQDANKQVLQKTVELKAVQ